ncbi:MAG: hypothetical protein GQ574_19230 [Crocinitomix sp.]|nr:hypothetical protein [Crocinitomix sp.]
MIYNTNGNSELSMFYDGDSSWLKISGSLIAINVRGPHQNFPNSYLVKCNFKSNRVNEILKKLDFEFTSSINFFENNAEKFERLLSFFEPGQYYIATPVYNIFGLNCFVEEEFKLIIGNFETGLAPFLCVRDKLDLDIDVIESYKQNILNGINPIIISYRKDYGSETGDSYIIDGHHKLIAYHELKIEPKIWEIVKLHDEVYDETDQELCKFLNHKEIKDTSLKYFYKTTEDHNGLLTKISIK